MQNYELIEKQDMNSIRDGQPTIFSASSLAAAQSLARNQYQIYCGTFLELSVDKIVVSTRAPGGKWINNKG